MRLRYLELENFLSHKDTKITFPEEGLFLLAGESGAGKSSLIIDAVSYALYGAAATRAKKQTDLINDNDESGNMRVKAVFEFEGQRTLAIERGLIGGTSTAKAYGPDHAGNTKLLAEGPKPVGELVARQLGGMSWQQFYSAFVARQDEISKLTDLRGSERKQLVHRMLGMRELEKAVEINKERVRRAKAERDQDYSDIPALRRPKGTFVSLYAGAGGLDIGFVLAGYQPVWTNELDPDAAATHEALFGDLAQTRPHLDPAPVITGDMLDLPPDRLPREGCADLVIGGPPCQGFSVAGKMDPHDPRSRHVFHFMDIVERVQPRGFVMENVKALMLNRRFELVRRRLRERAADLGYRAEMFLLDASHHGVPQARERMIFMGFRDTDPVAPEATTAENPPTLREVLETLPAYGQPGNDAFCTARITPARRPIMRLSPYAGMLVNGAGRPMDLDSPAPTLRMDSSWSWL